MEPDNTTVGPNSKIQNPRSSLHSGMKVEYELQMKVGIELYLGWT